MEIKFLLLLQLWQHQQHQWLTVCFFFITALELKQFNTLNKLKNLTNT